VCRGGAPIAAAELDALCLDHIARFKRPRAYRFVDAIPKNNYGKVLKTALRERLGEHERDRARGHVQLPGQAPTSR
jgi:long-chain acyl-CoA synthetase